MADAIGNMRAAGDLTSINATPALRIQTD